MCFPQYEDSIDVVSALLQHNLSTHVTVFVHVQDNGKLITVKPEKPSRKLSFGYLRHADEDGHGNDNEFEEEEEVDEELEIYWDWTVEPVRSYYRNGEIENSVGMEGSKGDTKDKSQGLSRVRAQYHAQLLGLVQLIFLVEIFPVIRCNLVFSHLLLTVLKMSMRCMIHQKNMMMTRKY